MARCSGRMARRVALLLLAALLCGALGSATAAAKSDGKAKAKASRWRCAGSIHWALGAGFGRKVIWRINPSVAAA